MSDELVKGTEKLTSKMVSDSKEQLKTLAKLKAMSKLAKDLGQDTAMADKFIDVGETVLKDIVSKLAVKK